METEVTQSWEECKGTSESWSASTTTTFAFTQSVEVSASVFEIVEASSNSEFQWQEDTTTESSTERSTETCASVSVVVTIEPGKALHAHVTQGNGTASLPWTVSWASEKHGSNFKCFKGGLFDSTVQGEMWLMCPYSFQSTRHCISDSTRCFITVTHQARTG